MPLLITLSMANGAVAAISVPAASSLAPQTVPEWAGFSSREVNAGAMQVLGPVVADATFGRLAWGLVLAAPTIRASAGGLLAARWQPRRALLVGVAVTLADAVPLALLAHAPLGFPCWQRLSSNGIAIELFTV